MNRFGRWHAVTALILVSVLSLTAGLQLNRGRVAHRAEKIEVLKADANERARRAAAGIDLLLADAQATGNDLLERLNRGEITSANASEMTKKILEQHPKLWGVGINYDRRLASAPPAGSANHYTTRPGGTVKAGTITYAYEDPDEPKGHWWQQAMKVGNVWVPPYLGGTTRKMVAVYAGRFYGPEAPPDGSPAGAIIVSIQLDTINRDVAYSELGATGYGFVVSRSGSYPEHPSKGLNGGYVSHPLKSYWRGADVPTFTEVMAKTANPSASAILDSGTDVSGGIDYRDELTGEDAWLFAAPIATADWVLGFVAVKSVLLDGDVTQFHYAIGVGMALITAATALLIALTLALLHDQVRIWVATTVLTLTPTCGVAMIWVLAHSETDRPQHSTQAVDEASDLEIYGSLADLGDAIDVYEDYVSSVSNTLEPATVLAGIFVQALQPVPNSSNWRVAGTAWQRYANGVPEGEEPGFVFPDAVTPAEFQPFYDVQDGDTRTIAWRFSVALEPSRNVSKYPLDEMDLTLRMAHRAINRPIVLVPDVAEYDLIAPIALPGVAPELAPDEFEITESRWGFTTSTINSTLGIPNFSRQRGFPELTFTIHMNRKFLDPFLSQMLPLLVMMLLLFAAHVIGTRPGEWTLVTPPARVSRGLRGRVWGDGVPGADPWDERGVDDPSHATFYVQATMASVLALMLVAILSQNSLRDALDASEIVYIEYAYFSLYAALLLVALNSLLFSTGRGGRFVHWRRNLLAELVYWPALGSLLFAATLYVFW